MLSLSVPYQSFAMSLASMAWETAQVRVTRTFLEVVEMCPAPEPRSRTMPALPSLGLDLDGRARIRLCCSGRAELRREAPRARSGPELQFRLHSDPARNRERAEQRDDPTATLAGEGVARPGGEGRVHTRLRFCGRAERRREVPCCKGCTHLLGGQARCDRR